VGRCRSRGPSRGFTADRPVAGRGGFAADRRWLCRRSAAGALPPGLCRRGFAVDRPPVNVADQRNAVAYSAFSAGFITVLRLFTALSAPGRDRRRARPFRRMHDLSRWRRGCPSGLTGRIVTAEAHVTREAGFSRANATSPRGRGCFAPFSRPLHPYSRVDVAFVPFCGRVNGARAG
jgi:hypothetical protein